MRLIDADALKEDLKEAKEELWKIYYGLSNHSDKQICVGQISSFTDAILKVKDAATIDAVPVVHGRWLTQIVLGQKAWDCSECKTIGSPHWKWCPVCGARMDGE